LVKNRNKLKPSEFISSLPCTSRKFDPIIYMADPLLHGGSQDGTVTILTRLWAERFSGLNPSRSKRLLFPPKCPD